MKYKKSINDANREFNKLQSGKPEDQVYQNRKRLQEERKRPIKNYTKAWEEFSDEAEDIEDFYGR